MPQPDQAGAPPPSDYFVDDIKAAEFLDLSRSYLRKLRVNGGGPKFCRLGQKAIRYRVSELLQWAGSKTANSTTECEVAEAV